MSFYTVFILLYSGPAATSCDSATLVKTHTFVIIIIIIIIICDQLCDVINNAWLAKFRYLSIPFFLLASSCNLLFPFVH